MATLLSKRVPLNLDDEVRIAIAWNMSYSFEELRDKRLEFDLLAERLFARRQTVGWIIEVLGEDGLQSVYPRYKILQEYI
ncbi:MAG: hypothetical protein CMI58_02920 [Parcubacteria group bacterium]|jgi:nitrogen fixation protein FixH|nr:hypothetical protein [Parcubacteria group bacterium]|tara:strand:- start:258 stop:497 length:240 start_codon:yes stop_codon:yes gene_type:complete